MTILKDGLVKLFGLSSAYRQWQW